MILKNLNEFTILEKIGEGSFGKVYKVRRNLDSEIYVLKQVDLSLMDTRLRNTALLQAKILNQIKSEYIVHYHASLLQNNILYIIMEYCDGGDLATFIRKNNKIPLKQQLIWKWLMQIASGLRDLHKKGILHRDIKSLNIFLTKSQDLRIGDLGVARELKGKFANTIVGTPYYLSPEMCEEKPYNQKTDIWAFGCLLYELSNSGKKPFQANNIHALTLKIITGKYNPISTTYSKPFRQIIKSCLKVDYRQRPSAAEILEKAENIINPVVVTSEMEKRNYKIVAEYAQEMPISLVVNGLKNIKSLSKNNVPSKSRNKSELVSDKNTKPRSKIGSKSRVEQSQQPQQRQLARQGKQQHIFESPEHRLPIKKQHNPIKSEINKQYQQQQYRKVFSELPIPCTYQEPQILSNNQINQINKNDKKNTTTAYFEYEIPVFHTNQNDRNEIDKPENFENDIDVQEEIQDNQPFTEDLSSKYVLQEHQQFLWIGEEIQSKKHSLQSLAQAVERKKRELLEYVRRKQIEILKIVSPEQYTRLFKLVYQEGNMNKINGESPLFHKKQFMKLFLAIVKGKMRIDHIMGMISNSS